MLSKLITGLATVLPCLSIGQTQLYFEDFSGQNNLGALGHSSGTALINMGTVSWTIDVSQANLSASSDWFLVRNEHLEGRDLDGEAIWYSPNIGIASYQGIEIKIEAQELGTMEARDYLIAEYRVDAGAWNEFHLNGALYDDFTAVDVNHFGNSGQSLELRVRFLNNASSEYHSIDNIEVLAYSELLYSSGQWNRAPDIYSDSIDVRIASNETVTLSADANLKNLNLEANAQLTLSSGKFLKVHEAIQNDGVIRIENNSNLIQTALVNQNTGSGQYQVLREYLAPDHERFSFWSSPIQNAEMQTVFASTYSGDRYRFDAGSQNYIAYSTGPLVAGQGYACAPSAQTSSQVSNFNDQRLFTGTLNNGDLSLSISGIQGGDWLLIGNPYPSTMDTQLWLLDNPDIVPSIYYWDSSTPTKSGAAFASWNSLGAVAVPFSARQTPSQDIGVCQAFMVQIDPSFTGNSLILKFKNEHRSSGQPSFYKHEFPFRSFYLSLKKGNKGISNLIVLLDSISPKNSTLQKESASGLGFYSFDIKERYTLQAISGPYLGSVSKVKIGLEAADSGLYSLSLDSIVDAQGMSCYLFNRIDSSYHDLTKGSKSLIYRENELDTCYEIHFLHHGWNLERDILEFPNAQVYWEMEEGLLNFFTRPNGPKIKSISLYKLDGKKIYQFNKDEGFSCHRVNQGIPENAVLIIAEIHLMQGQPLILKIPQSKSI